MMKGSAVIRRFLCSLLLIAVIQNASCFSFHHSPSFSRATALFSSVTSNNNEALRAALIKPSKTTTVILEVTSAVQDDDDLSYLSLQLRKNKINALCSSNLHTVGVLAQEQSTATGNFPGPCPVLYDSTATDDDDDDGISKAIEVGASGIIVQPAFSSSLMEGTPVTAQWIWKCSNVEDVKTILSNRGMDAIANDAFLFHVIASHDDMKQIEDIEQDVEQMISCIQEKNEENVKSPLLIGQVFSMMGKGTDENSNASREIQIARKFKASKCPSVFVSDACIGDSEDIEYARYFLSEVTSKSSTTFKMTGLTGSANGHFGGVQSQSQGQTWKRRS